MIPSDTNAHAPHAGPIARTEDLVTGAIVIVLGLALLAANLGVHVPFPAGDRWWALFILVGAVSPACKAFARFRLAGRVDAVVAHRAIQAAVVLAIALMFLLDVSFAVWWPAFVIIGGLHAMVPRRGRRSRRDAA